MIELVAATDGLVGRQQRLAGQRQIADRIEHLVAHELVGKAQALRIEHAVFADHQRVVERGAEREARAPELGDVLHEAEGARARDVALGLLAQEKGACETAVEVLVFDRAGNLAGKAAGWPA